MRPRLSWKTSGAIGSGVMLALAYEPVNWFGLAWVALAPLILIARCSEPRDGLKLGYLSGLVFWLISFFWLTILGVTGVPWPMAALAWISLSVYCAVYTAVFLAIICAWFKRMGTEDWRMNLLFVFLAPALWAGLEYIRGQLLTGFPWSTLAVSQYRNPLVCQVADIGGIYMVSAFLVMMNVVITLTAIHFKGVKVGKRYKTHPELMAGLLVLSMVFSHGIKSFSRIRPSADVINISGIQLNIEQTKKWPEEWYSIILNKLAKTTGMAVAPWVDLIVWPETSAPSYALLDPNCQALIYRVVLSNNIPVLAGSMDWRLAPDGSDLFYNSAMFFSAGTNPPVIYDKQHLVPFGEYIPLRRIFPILDKLAPLNWSCAGGTDSTVFTLKKSSDAGVITTKFASMICFEDIFPYIARNYVRKGARLLINQTNDAWFDDSSGPRRQMADSVFRSIENRVPTLRVTNTGVTCLIDALGRVVKDPTVQRFIDTSGTISYDPFESVRKEGFLTASVEVPPDDMELTLYTRYGDVFGIACAAVSFLSIVLVVGRPAIIRFSNRRNRPGENE